MTHELKCWPESFRALVAKEKTAEFRRDDRGFAVGDLLHLREWDPVTETYSNSQGCWIITHIERGFGISEGFCMLSVKR